MVAALAEADGHLLKFAGRVRQIDDRPYLSFPDYQEWRGRLVKNGLLKKVETGIVRSSWNAWIEANANDGVTSLAGVQVQRIDSSTSDLNFEISQSFGGLDRRLKDRARFFSAMHRREPQSGESLLDLRCDWHAEAEDLERAISGLREIGAGLGHRYFAGSELLFPQSADRLGALTKAVRSAVRLASDIWSQSQGDQSSSFDCATKLKSESPELGVPRRSDLLFAPLVLLAKFETLESMEDAAGAASFTKQLLQWGQYTAHRIAKVNLALSRLAKRRIGLAGTG